MYGHFKRGFRVISERATTQPQYMCDRGGQGHYVDWWALSPK